MRESIILDRAELKVSDPLCTRHILYITDTKVCTHCQVYVNMYCFGPEHCGTN